ncbi:hypothetical protein COR50_14070 [Chitinophaga caeni]|uniref:Uncharacterized protein n=1 Tax=Chitinophaga caeni TaxID=2029983 RepID=A0A291QW83_9BACT|nr:hypothetical protein [Chitinophaga caeni]ATL48197.1 hypothetical protein COR50_14070 [Chitinophaga caeni]
MTEKLFITEKRITKYNPIYRDTSGRFLKDEWTSYTDVGENIGGKVLSIEEYLKVEGAYINAVDLFFKELGITQFLVLKLEKYGIENLASEDIKNYKEAINEQVYSLDKLSMIVRMNLRAYIWCELVSLDKKSRVEFGYDYYMYFISNKKIESSLWSKIEKLGLFVD